MTPLATLGAMAKAEARMQRAKVLFTRSVLATQRKDPNATALVNDALREVDAARLELRKALEGAHVAEAAEDAGMAESTILQGRST